VLQAVNFTGYHLIRRTLHILRVTKRYRKPEREEKEKQVKYDPACHTSPSSSGFRESNQCVKGRGFDSCSALSPPQRLLLVNTSERKKGEAGALEREDGSAGNAGKSLSFFPFPAFPARFNFSLFPSATVGGLCG